MQDICYIRISLRTRSVDLSIFSRTLVCTPFLESRTIEGSRPQKLKLLDLTGTLPGLRLFVGGTTELGMAVPAVNFFLLHFNTACWARPGRGVFGLTGPADERCSSQCSAIAKRMHYIALRKTHLLYLDEAARLKVTSILMHLKIF